MSTSPAPGTLATPFAKQAATFSLFAPLIAVLISIVGQPLVFGNRAGMMILGLVCVSLILGGLAFGIAALVSARHRAVPGIRGKAIIGTCLCGVLALSMALSIPLAIRATDRKREQAQQQLRQIGETMQKFHAEQPAER